MSHARIALVLCWAVMGCAAADGGLIAGIKGRLRGGKNSAPDGLAASSTTAPASGRQGNSANEIIHAGGAQSNLSPGAGRDPVQQPVGEIVESVVARVNGDVILAQNLFSPIRAQLAKAQQELPPAKFNQFKTELVQKQLRDLVERQLLIQQAKKTFPEAAIKRMEAIADKEFGKRIESEMKRMEVETESELRRRMLEQGESLDQFREFHRGTFIAQQYLRMQLAPRLDVSREEMLDYYNLHRDQFKKDAAVRWSEIFLSVEKYGSREAAHAHADRLAASIRAGGDFAELAKAQSEGATAGDGGKWELTTKGSHIVPAVDDALFSLPVGQISEPIEGPKGWYIVRTDDKQTGGDTSFVAAQDEIRRILREQKINKESQRYVQELAGRAQITTIFDK